MSFKLKDSAVKVFISTVPFGQLDHKSFDLMDDAGINYVVNPLGRKLREEDLVDQLKDIDVLIAGTEPLTASVLSQTNRLRLIARVGIGLDSVDLLAAKEQGISVSYTPDAPSAAVSELTISLMLNLLRSVHLSNQELHRGEWHRHLGRRLEDCTIGIIGAGRIGARVIRHLSGFGCRKVLVNDIAKSIEQDICAPYEWQDKNTIYREADVISIHVPLTNLTRDMISRAELQMMKPDAVLINTARGGIVNETALFEMLTNGALAGAAVDTFENEPYSGPLAELEQCILTAHIGSMTADCRARMEIEATQEAIRFLTGQPLTQEVPDEEYENQRPVVAHRVGING